MEDSCERYVLPLQMCCALEGGCVKDRSDVDYMEHLSMVLSIAFAAVVGEISAPAFCRNMDASDDCWFGSIAEVKSLLSGAKIPHMVQFLKKNPRRYA